MGVHRGADHTVAEYFNTGGQPDGSLIGWPDCKEFIPLDFCADPVPGRLPQRRRRERPARRLLRAAAAGDAGAAGPGRRGAPGRDDEHAHRRDVHPPPAPLHRAGSHADLRRPLPEGDDEADRGGPPGERRRVRRGGPGARAGLGVQPRLGPEPALRLALRARRVSLAHVLDGQDGRGSRSCTRPTICSTPS